MLKRTSPTAPWRDELAQYAAEFEALRAEDGERLGRAALYREEIEATRDPNRAITNDTSDYGRVQRNTTQLTRHRFNFPLAQALTVKHAYRISGRMPDAVVPRREENAKERWRSDAMEKMWWGVTDACEGDVQFSDAAWDASQIGAAAFECYYDLDAGIPLYRAQDTGSCVVVRGLDDPHSFERIYRWWEVPLHTFELNYANESFRGAAVQTSELEVFGDQAKVTIVEMCDKKQKIRFARSANKNVPAIGIQEVTHNLGFTPFVVIPNLGPQRKVWGWADYDFVREIGSYINRFYGREADIVRAVANGSVMVRGTKLSPLQIQQLLQEGGVIPVGRDGDILPVQVPEMPSFSVEHGQRAFDLLERLGFAPPAAWGSIGAQSGSDRGLQLQPLFELTALKQKNWSAGLSRLGRMVFETIDKKGGTRATYAGVHRSGAKRKSFAITLGTEAPAQGLVDEMTGEAVDLPTSPKELFSGDYRVRFEFASRIDFDDPAYVASELNKFAQGVQSARTTLERLGFPAPEDELKLIEQEAEQFPWLRQGMIKLLEMQLNQSQQGANDGSQNFDPAEAQMGAMGMMQTKDGASLDADAATSALQGGVGQLYGGA